jgi:integrase
MPYAQVPAFYAKLAALDTVESRALRFVILSGARTDEIIGAKHKAPATWGEISEVDGLPTWIIDGSRMKGKKEHRVPLSPVMVALLGKRRADDIPLFEVSGGADVLLNTLRANDGNGFTVHGFRNTISEWIVETTEYDAELADMCIAHETKSKVRKAYQRGDLLERRRPILQRWSDFVTAGACS